MRRIIEYESNTILPKEIKNKLLELRNNKINIHDLQRFIAIWFSDNTIN